MTKMVWMAGAAALALCAPAAAQRPGPGLAGPPGGPGTVAMTAPPPPVYALIGRREALGLSARQVAALDSIGAWVSAADRPVLRRLNEVLARRRGTDTAVVNAEQLLAANRERAAQGVHALLTTEQRTRTCELFRAPEPRAGERSRRAAAPIGGGGGSVERAGRPGSAPPGGAAMEVAFYRWPWCPPPAPAEAPRRQPRRP